MKKTFLEFCDGYRIEVDIPNGFSYKEGEVDNGLIIENEAGSQYLRIPAGYTSDGLYVRGFWLSRYEISLGNDEEPLSIPDRYPVTNVNFYEAVELARKVANGYIPSKEEYNRICMWLVSTKAATFEEVFETASRGNYSTPFVLAKTGENPSWMINRLDNFFGNCSIWTTERSELYDHNMIIRGGHGLYANNGEKHPASFRRWANPEEGYLDNTLRIVIRDLYD